MAFDVAAGRAMVVPAVQISIGISTVMADSSTLADSPSMIGVILKLAAYTYGPLLGLFGFGILTRRILSDRLVPFITIGAPVICALLEINQEQLFGTYRFGLELLMINGILVFGGLWAISRPEKLDAVAAPA